MKERILSSSNVQQIVKRMSFQIHEHNMDEEIVLVGVGKGGEILAEKIMKNLQKIADKEVVGYTLHLNKSNPLIDEIEMNGDIKELEDKVVILCDDVLNSGKTLAYSLSKLLSHSLKKVETAVLVLRSHSKFPIYATYTGYELSTTINEHIEVVDGKGVFLR